MKDTATKQRTRAKDRKLTQTAKARLVMGLFFVSTLMILLVSVYENIRMNRHMLIVNGATRNHLLAAAKAAAKLVSAKELDLYHRVEDIDVPEYQELKKRLAAFAEEYEVLYVYYWRDYGDGRIQYIIDNDDDPETMHTPKVFFDIENKADPITTDAVPRILGGGTRVSDLSSYTASGNGLISANAPVYRDNGTVYCAAGVDLSDEGILVQKRDSRNIMIIQICALLITVVCGTLNILLNWYKAYETDESRYTGDENGAAAPARGKKKLPAWLTNITTSGKYSVQSKFGMSDYFIRYVLLNAIIIFGATILLVFASINLAKGIYLEALICTTMALIAVGTFIMARTKIPQGVPAAILMLFYGILCITIIWTGEALGSNFIFIYMYPMCTTMLLGMNTGIALSLILIAAVGVEIFVPGMSRFVYHFDVSIRIIAGYALVFFVMLIVEVTRKTKDRLIEDQSQRLLELKETAETASKTKSNFLANMSHEIRTPMNAIVGMAELILRGELPDESREYARDIKQASANLLSIINDLLDFSKIEAGRMEITPVKYYLSSLVNDVVNIIRMRIMEKPIRFYTNIDAGIPNELFGDETRVRQILLNLLGNAVKYTERGFISITITQEAPEESPQKSALVKLKIVVADSGSGIKPEDKQKLFEDFVQVDTKRNRAIEGTGLGLAITKRLCTAMGGNISMESEYGKGSAFTVIIPQGAASDMPFAKVDNPEGKKVLVYEGRIVYAKSVLWSLENLSVPHALVTDLDGFAEALVREEWYFVFSGYGLYQRLKPVMDKLEKKPPLALMVEWGTEGYIPGVRFVSLPAQSLSIADTLNGAPDQRAYMESAFFTGTRFTVPDAHLLVVDDIITNLKVAEGLIAPYRAKVDTCLSGVEAIELVKRRPYDLVFMDHMMPEMDGVEAVSIIRAWEKEQAENTEIESPPSRIPIIALTANAVSGMREMFLAQDFNDFLAKPIDVSKLDEIIARWISREKIHKADTRREEVRLEPASSPLTENPPQTKDLLPGSSPSSAMPLGLPAIPDVDMAKGIAMTGGTWALYQQVLAAFEKDARERLPPLRETPRQEGLPLFITQVHALKSASASIGAAGVSVEAARLEAAGKAGDLALIADELPAFTVRLSELAENIHAALDSRPAAPALGQAQGPESPNPQSANYYPLLNELAQALGSQEIRNIDQIMEELFRLPLDSKIRKTLEQISDQVLLAEFDKARETLNENGLLNGLFNEDKP